MPDHQHAVKNSSAKCIHKVFIFIWKRAPKRLFMLYPPAWRMQTRRWTNKMSELRRRNHYSSLLAINIVARDGRVIGDYTCHIVTTTQERVLYLGWYRLIRAIIDWKRQNLNKSLRGSEKSISNIALNELVHQVVGGLILGYKVSWIAIRATNYRSNKMTASTILGRQSIVPGWIRCCYRTSILARNVVRQ